MLWNPPPTPKIPPNLLTWASQHSPHSLLARLLVQRGLNQPAQAQAFINPQHYQPAPPSNLPDLTAGVARLGQALTQNEKICVWGDFDVDGQSSTALLVQTLRHLGANVSYYIPDRLTEGHGLHPPKLASLLTEGVDLILTCDTGIAAHTAAEQIQQAGASLIITDHHDLPETLPPAEAIINPKRLPEEHPLRQLPGVGVAYQLALGLCQAQGQRGWAEANLLDLVALGIVADVAEQQNDTRYLLQLGLQSLRESQRVGLQALVKMCNLKQNRLTAEHIGFYLGPRLNALGRLGDANQGVELLLTQDTGRAQILSAQLDALNERRRLLVERTVVQALSHIEDNPALADYKAIVLAGEDWAAGVIGIAASRLVEQFNRPVILLTQRHGDLRGSARSVPGCDIHQALKTQAPLLTSFGGHPMAAGLRLLPENLTAFRRGLSQALSECVSNQPPRLNIDAFVTLSDLNLGLLDSLDLLAPFGAGNPPITLAVRGVQVVQDSTFGRTRTHRRLTVQDSAGETAQVLWWQGAGEILPNGQFDVALRLSRDDYRREAGVQLTWVAHRQEKPPQPAPKRTLHDWRGLDQAAAVRYLAEILAEGGDSVRVWAVQGEATMPRLPARPEVGQSLSGLVIWHAPPSQQVLQSVLQAWRPGGVYVRLQANPFDGLTAFVRQVMGLVKYAVQHYGGQVDLAELAWQVGHQPGTVAVALRWLAAQGKLAIIAESDALWQVRPAKEPPQSEAVSLQAELVSLLEETAAYRQFAQGASLAGLGLGQ